MTDTAALAGRVHEVEFVTAVLGGGTYVDALLITGEAGIGKSRLVAAAAATAADRADVIVVSGWCLRLSEGLPFLPVVDVLRTLTEVDDGGLIETALSTCPQFVRAELVRLLPELGEAEDRSLPAQTDDGWRQQRLFEALRRLFAALPTLRRLAVVIEDVHWADVTTLEFLDYLLAPGHAPGFPIVLTLRTEEQQTPEVTRWLERLARNQHVSQLDVPPLARAETAELIELLLGQPPSASLVERIFTRSEGNAFFTEQLVAARDSHSHGDELPAGLRSLLLSRTGQVGGTARDVLSTLAIAWRPLDETTLVELCGCPERDVREALRDLLARRLLRRPDDEGRHQLRHALVAEAVSSEMLPSERRELHARAAEVMERWNDPSVAAHVAEHFAAAGRSTDELRWRVIAGRHADTVFASKEAARHWRRAVLLSARAPVTEVVEGLTLAELYGAAEDALTMSGASQSEIRELAEEALARLGTADLTSRAEVMRRAGEIRDRSASTDGLPLLYQAVELYEQLPPSAGHVKALRNIQGILVNAGRQTQAAEVTRRAVAVAEKVGQPQAYLEIVSLQAWHEMAAGQGQLAVDRIDSLREGLGKQDQPEAHAWLAMCHSDILLNLGRLDEVDVVGAMALRLAATYGMEHSPVVVALRRNVFEALTELGKIDAAARLIDRVSNASADVGNRSDYDARAALELLRGNLDGARQRWLDLEELPPQRLAFRAETSRSQAELHLWRGFPEDAFRISHALLVEDTEADEGRLSGAPLTFAGQLLNIALRACADRAEHARATRQVEALGSATSWSEQLADLHRRMTPDPFSPGPMRPTATADSSLWRAEWTRVQGELQAGLWEEAATAWDEMGRPHRSAYARWRQAEVLLADPAGRASAPAVLRSAAGQAAAHVPLANAIADLARRARIDLTAPVERPTQTAPSQAFGLTERELAVLSLLAEGKSNSEIGEALFISRSTVGVHVTHILRKLDVATRVQAATIAERAGIAGIHRT